MTSIIGSGNVWVNVSDVMTAHLNNPDDAVQNIQVQCSRIIILELCSHFLLLKEETTLPTCRFRIKIDELNIKLYSYIYIIDLVFPIRSFKHDYLFIMVYHHCCLN